MILRELVGVRRFLLRKPFKGFDIVAMNLWKKKGFDWGKAERE